jgi:hypothetical protein
MVNDLINQSSLLKTPKTQLLGVPRQPKMWKLQKDGHPERQEASSPASLTPPFTCL